MNDYLDSFIIDWHSIIEKHVREIVECLESSFLIGEEYYESKRKKYRNWQKNVSLRK